MNEIYLDNSATTRVDEPVAREILRMLTEDYGNPSSLHGKGIAAELALTNARRALAQALGVKPEEIFFTSGGTEANNLAILGSMQRGRRMGRRVVTTAVEHSSVLDSFRELERLGCPATYLKPDRWGCISVQELLDAVDENTALVSVMMVNNEVGSIMPIQQMAQGVKRISPDCLFHCDGVQALGKLPVRPARLGVDLLTVSAHKIHGPKGVGALYVRKGVNLAPRAFGGRQERGLRVGTEPTALIAGFGRAVEELDPVRAGEHAARLAEELRQGLARLPGVAVNSPAQGLPWVISLSVPGIRSETMIHYLEQQGVYVSSGSACAKGARSHVLCAMGLEDPVIDGALRVSFCKHSTSQDVAGFLAALESGMSALQRAGETTKNGRAR